MSKKQTNTKVISTEYAIINKDGEVTGTDNEEIAIQALQKGLNVYKLTTYQLTLKTKLNKED